MSTAFSYAGACGHMHTHTHTCACVVTRAWSGSGFWPGRDVWGVTENCALSIGILHAWLVTEWRCWPHPWATSSPAWIPAPSWIDSGLGKIHHLPKASVSSRVKGDKNNLSSQNGREGQGHSVCKTSRCKENKFSVHGGWDCHRRYRYSGMRKAPEYGASVHCSHSRPLISVQGI